MFHFYLPLWITLFSVTRTSEVLPNSCENLSDGFHWLKLMDGDEYPPVYLKCSNGYTILDFTSDNNIQYYFTSWSEWHVGTVGPTNDHSINWQDWYIPDTTFNPKSTPNFHDNLFFQSPDSTDINKAITNNEGNYNGPISTSIDYLISPDCSICDETNSRQLYGTSTTYWMTGTLFGCFWAVKGAHNCDVDWDTDTCYTCNSQVSDTIDTQDTDGITNYINNDNHNNIQHKHKKRQIGTKLISGYGTGRTLVDQGHDRNPITDSSTEEDFDDTGICPHNVRESNHYVPLTHDQCAHDEGNNRKHLKPSLGVKGKHCVCVQPKQEHSTFYEIEQIPESPVRAHEVVEAVKEMNGVKSSNNNIDNEDEMDVFYLYQSDFSQGTFRIKKPGKYVIMEDILFDYGGFDDNDINNKKHGMGGINEMRSFEDNYEYWPKSSDNDEYPGAAGARDPYFLGFFAGITVECDNVVLELGEHTLEMSEHFYYQQRWFTTIELATQYFLPGQGIGNFGANPSVASNVVIRNGVLGLTSHHGIHGNYNNNIRILNLQVRDFETHGIQLNGFNNIILKNVEIGPTSTRAFFTGEYGHMRALLPRLRAIADEHHNEQIHFYGRDEPTTIADITDEIQLQLDMAFDYIANGKEYNPDSTDPDTYQSFLSSQKLFINPSGLPNGGAMYGIFLNTFGASVFTYNLYTGFYSTNAILEDITIHDMKHEMKEYVRLFKQGGDIVINPFNGPLNAEEMFEDITDVENGLLYKGNIVLDAYIAMNYITDNWDYLGMQLILNSYITPWALGHDLDAVNTDNIAFGCNSDVMIHSGKGINGLRLDGVKDVTIRNLNIYNLHDYTPLGNEKCGNYDDLSCANCGESGGHFRQTQPMQIGFTGNMNQAINVNAAVGVIFNNININGVYSNTGPSFGLSIWPACDVVLKGNINVKNLESGKELKSGSLSYDDRPNKAPETCSVRVYWEYGDYNTRVRYNDANIVSECLTGHVGCMGKDLTESSATILGSVNSLECDDNIEHYSNEREENVIIDNIINVWNTVSGLEMFRKNKMVLYSIFGLLGAFIFYLILLSCWSVCKKIRKSISKCNKHERDGYERIKDLEMRKQSRSLANALSEASELL